MPQLSSGGEEDLGASDEMIAFKDEGEQEEKIPENAFTERDLADLKTSLVSESEAHPEAIRRAQDAHRGYQEKLADHMEDGIKHQEEPMYKGSGYSSYPFLMLSDPYLSNGSMSTLSSKVPVVQPSHGVHPLTPLIPYNNEPFSHSSHSPHLPADLNQKPGAHRPSQTPDIPAFYSIPPGGVGQISPSMGWFTHPLMLGSGVHTTGIPHPAIVPHSGNKDMDCYGRGMKPHSEPKREREPKKPTIKKPLNAFMLYMKEMRAKVIAECTLKESAAINQILGRRWHALSREEQAKYYELARKERQLHMQLYPGWSARDNYGKKKRRSREKHQDSSSGGKRSAFGTYKEKDAVAAQFLPMEVL
ncbi:transcription factor 7 isoform X7 [Anomaloglossus baeobatrachus]|uniref:transcription factor 7 isoform X7 n=1 Tax=Anomaloglossus baeobatrachus TaxID=238106 RepID=UPI003F50C12E